MDAADHSNGSATRNQPISHAWLSSFRPKLGQMTGIRPSAGHKTQDNNKGHTKAQHLATARAGSNARRSQRAGPPRSGDRVARVAQRDAWTPAQVGDLARISDIHHRRHAAVPRW